MINFSINSLFIKERNKKKIIPFNSLISDRREGSYKGNNFDCQLDFHILASEDDFLLLPKYHHSIFHFDIDYSKYFLIYASLGREDEQRSRVKIDKIMQLDNQMIIKVKREISSMDNFTLEVVDVPYDLVKVSKNKLIKTGSLNFKFLDYEDNLLYSNTIKIL